MGIGNAFAYSLYKPLKDNNEEKINLLINYFINLYKVIVLVILILGILLIPFLDNIIKEQNFYSNGQIKFFYILLLINSITSYSFVYKKTLLIADQKQYIVSIFTQIFFLLQSIIQMLILIMYENFAFYLILQILFSLLTNWMISKKVNKMYPYLKNNIKEKLENNEKYTILKNVKSLFLYKFGSIILNGTDNIFISVFIGIKAAGLSANYILIITSVSSLFGQIMNSLTGTIGKLNSSDDIGNKYKGFRMIFFVTIWIFGYLSGGLYFFVDSFISLWIGEKYLLSNDIILVLIVNFYLASTHFASYTSRITMGLFEKGKYSPIIAALLNIFASYILVVKFGLIGVFLGTLIAKLLTMFTVDPYLVYKHGFKMSVKSYWLQYITYTILIVINIFLCSMIIPSGEKINISNFIIYVILYSVIFNIIFVSTFSRFKDFKLLLNKAKINQINS